MTSLNLKNENNGSMKEIWHIWVPIILYQVYFLLSDMADKFTHYDLHTNNVLLYKLPEGKYIIMNYINKNGQTETTFKTIYIPKIIDYGRSFFYANDNFNSKILNDKILCKFKECNKIELNENCGEESGYTYFSYDKNNKPLKEQHYISAPIRNKSHDLRLAYIFKKHYSKRFGNDNADLVDLFDDIYYEEEFGTPEVVDNYTSKIKNVEDMKMELEERVLYKENFKNNLETYFSKNSDKYSCLGTLNIYEGNKHIMEFIPHCV